MAIMNSIITTVMIIIVTVIIIILDTEVFELELLFRCHILALSVDIFSLYLYSCSLYTWPLSC
jgi:hypothetical protein